MRQHGNGTVPIQTVTVRRIKMLFENIKKLVKYGLETGLIEENDVI